MKGARFLKPAAFTALGLVAAGGAGWAQEPANEKIYEAELQASSDQHMRDELGVNDITTPTISGILKDLDLFRPPPMEVINSLDREASYENRMQTALHFGSLVADGFVLTIAERPQDVQDIGKALIRQSRALGVGDRLTKRSKSLLELSDKGDWLGMREELVKTQAEVEQSMLDLRDEEMAHMISLGGWLRGFQIAAANTKAAYSQQKAAILGRVEIIDYYLDRLDTLHPRLKKTEFATDLTASIRGIRGVALESQGAPPNQEQVARMSDLANTAVAVALGHVDAEGRPLKKKSPPPQ